MDFLSKIDSKNFTSYDVADFLEKSPEFIAIPEDIRKSYNLADIEVDASDVTVEWSADLVLKEWGIADFTASIKRIFCTLSVKMLGEEDMNIPDKEFELEFDTSSFIIVAFIEDQKNDGWLITTNFHEKTIGDLIIPNEIEVDFSEKRIEINF